jgi:hypothetical protein
MKFTRRNKFRNSTKKNKQTRNKKTIIGGVPEINRIQYFGDTNEVLINARDFQGSYKRLYHSNILKNNELIIILTSLLSNTEFNNVAFKNKDFINSVTAYNLSEKLNYINNEYYRKSINDTLHWLLFDYNALVFPCLIDVLVKYVNDKDFNTENHLALIMKALNTKITDMEMNISRENIDEKNTYLLLKTILRIMDEPSIIYILNPLFDDLKPKFIQFNSTLKCLLPKLNTATINVKNCIRNLIIDKNVINALYYLGTIDGMCDVKGISDFATVYFDQATSKFREKVTKNVSETGRNVFKIGENLVNNLYSYLPALKYAPHTL